MLSRNQIDVIARASKIDQTTVFREYLQISIVQSFYANEKLVKTYFKGGTCLRFIFGSGRFSEDLDFTSNLQEQEIDAEIDRTVSNLKSEFPGIDVKHLDTIAGISRKIRLQTEYAPFPVGLKMDFSVRESVLDPEVSTPKTSYPISIIHPIPHLSMREIMAEKVRAIMKRRKGRDLYDLYFLLARNVLPDEKFIQKKMDYYREKYEIDKLILRIKDWSQTELKNDLGQFLPADARAMISQLPEMSIKLLKQK